MFTRTLYHSLIMGAVLKGTSPDRRESMTSTPYKWICFLTVKAPSGGVVYASGFIRTIAAV